MINPEQLSRDVIVIGASAGGVEAVRSLLAVLPAELPAGVAIVIHRSPVFESRLPYVLGRRAHLPVREPEDGEPFRHGQVYAAPRDQHMLFEDGVFRLTRGPKEHRTRPAIDPLFRTAAESFGNRVVGVVLSGLGGDGVSGLISIATRGGLSIVQDPSEAMYPTMPKSAIADDDVDAVLFLDDIGKALSALATGETIDVPGRDGNRAETPRR
jgi:two-component system chemotaxis response regulator CheB